MSINSISFIMVAFWFIWINVELSTVIYISSSWGNQKFNDVRWGGETAPIQVSPQFTHTDESEVKMLQSVRNQEEKEKSVPAWRIRAKRRWVRDKEAWKNWKFPQLEGKVNGQKPGRSAGTRWLTSWISRTDTRYEQKGELAGSLLYSSCCSRNQSRLEGESMWMHEHRGGKVYGSRNNTKSLMNNTRYLQRCKNMERCCCCCCCC